MLDRIHWKEPAEKARCLRSKITLTIDLAPEKPGGERTPFEQALRTIFPHGWTRKDAQWLARQAIKAVSEAIILDGCATSPLEAVMLHGSTRRGAVRLVDVIDTGLRVNGEEVA